MAPLRIQPGAIRRIRELAVAAWPLEGCGLVEGRRIGYGGTVRRVIPVANRHDTPAQAYLIEPEALLHAERDARMRGRSIMGVWHSHPHGDDRPSPRDLELALPGWSYLIAGVTNTGMCSLRCWRLHDGRFVEQDLRVMP